MREGMGLLAYSPLGFGRLTGKYRNGMPENSRFKLFPNLARFNGDNSIKATEAYYQVAQAFGVSLTQMALAFVTSRPFVTSNILGASSVDQLKENIDSIELSLSKGPTQSHRKGPRKYSQSCPLGQGLCDACF